MATNIFLIRHGESRGNTGENDEKRLPDHLVSLTEHGREQARVNGAVKNSAAKNRFALWISAPLR